MRVPEARTELEIFKVLNILAIPSPWQASRQMGGGWRDQRAQLSVGAVIGAGGMDHLGNPAKFSVHANF
jgi:hypothetical protein